MDKELEAATEEVNRLQFELYASKAKMEELQRITSSAKISTALC